MRVDLRLNSLFRLAEPTNVAPYYRGMRKQRPRKPGKGYWQQRDWRRRTWYRGSRQSIRLIVLGLFVGLVVGNFIYEKLSTHYTPPNFANLWERYKPASTSSHEANKAPKGWESHYRRAPDSGDPTYREPASSNERQVAASSGQFNICVTSIRITCVVDGDTIWYQGSKIRVEDIDAPEIFSPKCAAEKALGERAKYRLLELLNAGPFQLVRQGYRDRDRYGRLLRTIERNGQSLGMILVSEGLARQWDGRRHPWC